MIFTNHPKHLTFLLALLLLFPFRLFAINLHKKIELDYTPMSIVLPDGRVIKEFVATGDGQVYLPYQVIEDIVKEQVTLDDVHQTISIGTILSDTIMSNKLKVYHYDYDNAHAFLYCPDVKTNKTMTLSSKVHELGYSFANINSAAFNLDKAYKEITGLLGCEDFSASNGDVSFYLDGQLLETYHLTSDSLPIPIHLCVNGGAQLKIVFTNFLPNTQINLVDMYIH